VNEPEASPLTDAAEARDIEDSLMRELVRLRKKRKIGQEPIAKAIGVSQVRVSQMENLKGGVTLESVLIYARAIGANIVVVPESTNKKKDRDPS
jgi:transcriptional regulator with XRE-family HTH domain